MSDVLDLLKALIRCPSITPDDAGCQQIVAQRLEAAGFTIRHRPFGEVSNLWATHGSGSPLICFAGHTDVVPPGPLDSWGSPPFEPTESDGMLVGRGAVDMKASVAAMVVAAEQLAKEGHTGTVAILLTSDEEGPGINGTERVLRTLLDEGLKIDYALVGEPTSEVVFGDAIKVGRRGSLSGHLQAKGIQGHTAYPHLADNAMHRLNEAMHAILSLEWGDGNEFFQPTNLQFTNVNSGTGAGNVIPGVAQADFNVRYGTDWSADTICARISEAVKTEQIAIRWTLGAKPFLVDSKLLQDSIATAVRDRTMAQPRLSTNGGTSDARFFAAAGIPVAEFGPLNGTIHAANERVELHCLASLASIYRAIATQLLQ